MGRCIDSLLDEQGDLSAVERFAQFHEKVAEPLQARYYSALMPAGPPGPGQQYAFEVDLDRCSGCKACVTACHELNGLDEDETWRSVGLLHGGTSALPVLQHVTSACHHCLDPACLYGCPVNAYEKDPVTGIVKHLDDQCIGCQYCTLHLSVRRPKVSTRRGASCGSATCAAIGLQPARRRPACRRAPRGDPDQGRRSAGGRRGLRGRRSSCRGPPSLDYTLPTTIYKTSRRCRGTCCRRTITPCRPATATGRWSSCWC